MNDSCPFTEDEFCHYATQYPDKTYCGLTTGDNIVGVTLKKCPLIDKKKGKTLSAGTSKWAKQDSRKHLSIHPDAIKYGRKDVQKQLK